MRVAVVTTSYPKHVGDGAGHFVRTEALGLAAAGAEVTVIAPDATSLGDGIEVVGNSSGGAFGWPGAAHRIHVRPILAVGAARWVASARAALARLARFDRIIAHWAVPSGWVASGARMPFELVSHGQDVRLLVAAPRVLRERVVDALLSRTERWRFVSDALLERLTPCLGPALERRLLRVAVVLPSPIHIPDVSRARDEIRARQASPFYCSVGRLIPSKGVGRIIDHVAKEHRGTRLVVVGDGPSRARLEVAAMGAKVDASFVGTVPRHEALAWMAASDGLLFASEEEGCSTVLREARALGVAVRTVR